MPLTIKPASGSGSATLISVAGTTTNDTLTLPAKTGNIITSADSGTVTGTMLAASTVTQNNLASNVAGNGPAFSAYSSSAVSVSTSTNTKITSNTTRFDTNTNYATSRFTPTVAGYYYVSACLIFGSSASGYVVLSFYKNGASYFTGSAITNASVGPNINGSTIISMNGTTDYVEVYAFQNSGSTLNCTLVDFCGTLVRAA